MQILTVPQFGQWNRWRPHLCPIVLVPSAVAQLCPKPVGPRKGSYCPAQDGSPSPFWFLSLSLWSSQRGQVEGKGFAHPTGCSTGLRLSRRRCSFCPEPSPLTPNRVPLRQQPSGPLLTGVCRRFCHYLPLQPSALSHPRAAARLGPPTG